MGDAGDKGTTTVPPAGTPAGPVVNDLLLRGGTWSITAMFNVDGAVKAVGVAISDEGGVIGHAVFPGLVRRLVVGNGDLVLLFTRDGSPVSWSNPRVWEESALSGDGGHGRWQLARPIVPQHTYLVDVLPSADGETFPRALSHGTAHASVRTMLTEPAGTPVSQPLAGVLSDVSTSHPVPGPSLPDNEAWAKRQQLGVNIGRQMFPDPRDIPHPPYMGEAQLAPATILHGARWTVSVDRDDALIRRARDARDTWAAREASGTGTLAVDADTDPAPAVDPPEAVPPAAPPQQNPITAPGYMEPPPTSQPPTPRPPGLPTPVVRPASSSPFRSWARRHFRLKGDA